MSDCLILPDACWSSKPSCLNARNASIFSVENGCVIAAAFELSVWAFADNPVINPNTPIIMEKLFVFMAGFVSVVLKDK